MSEIKFTQAHALIGMYIEMTAADGQMDKVELQTVGSLVRFFLEPSGFDADARKKIIGESFDWWYSFKTVKERVQAVFTAAAGVGEAFPKETRMKIAKGLMLIGNADGEVHKQEKSFVSECMVCLGLTFEDLK
ncbi:TerB family tellurite resistance protein [Flavobacteriaceae bacterium]|nr:TerB family tellurite resistance protein [Flavobacteriaceae bacterium]MDB4239825.1 TerB family tellurite resistance protein [Flavobacteriaceae bacterium]